MVPTGNGRRLVIAFELPQQIELPSPSGIARTPSSDRSADYPRLAFRRDYKTSFPIANVLVSKYLRDAQDETLTIRRMQADEQDAAVCPRSESPDVGKIQILRDQESFFFLCRIPNLVITLAAQFSWAMV
jgi:hypothetical protein